MYEPDDQPRMADAIINSCFAAACLVLFLLAMMGAVQVIDSLIDASSDNNSSLEWSNPYLPAVAGTKPYVSETICQDGSPNTYGINQYGFSCDLNTTNWGVIQVYPARQPISALPQRDTSLPKDDSSGTHWGGHGKKTYKCSTGKTITVPYNGIGYYGTISITFTDNLWATGVSDRSRQSSVRLDPKDTDPYRSPGPAGNSQSLELFRQKFIGMTVVTADTHPGVHHDDQAVASPPQHYGFTGLWLDKRDFVDSSSSYGYIEQVVLCMRGKSFKS